MEPQTLSALMEQLGRQAPPVLAQAHHAKNFALAAAAAAVGTRPQILAANALDMAAARGGQGVRLERLQLDQARVATSPRASMRSSPCPIHRQHRRRWQRQRLTIRRVRVPWG
jgi:gamma-glutamyl phosphate reductase